MKIPLLKTYEDIEEKSPGKTSEKNQSPGSKIVPVFVFNVANNVSSAKKSTIPSLKDRIKERILDLVDTNAFKTPYTPSRDHRKEIEDNTKSLGFGSPSPLIKVTPMKHSLQKEKSYLTPKRKDGEAKSSADIISTEPDCQPIVNSVLYSPFGAEKMSKRASSLKRGDTWSGSSKPKSINNIPMLTPQKTMEYNTEDNGNGQWSKTGDFAFKMTYFKPIDESKLDEFINSTNVSRTHKTSFITNTTPRSSASPVKKRTPSEIKSKLDRSQDVMNNTKEHSAIRPVKIEAVTPKKVEGRSISNQKPRTFTPVKTNSKVTNAGYKIDLDTSQKCMTSRMEEKKKPGKSVESFRAGNTGDNTQRGNAKNKNIFGLDKGENAYFKLDKLLLELKTNNTTSKAIREDESNSVTDTASEAGLFNLVVEKSKESGAVSYAAKNSFRSTLIGMRENS